MDMNSDFFDILKYLPISQLKLCGMSLWSEESGLWLFPKEWYDHIPNGFVLTSISGEVFPFEKGKSDDDTRMGALPYGIVPEKKV